MNHHKTVDFTQDREPQEVLNRAMLWSELHFYKSTLVAVRSTEWGEAGVSGETSGLSIMHERQQGLDQGGESRDGGKRLDF